MFFNESLEYVPSPLSLDPEERVVLPEIREHLDLGHSEEEGVRGQSVPEYRLLEPILYCDPVLTRTK